MKLIFLGGGAAFIIDDDNYQSIIILETDDSHRLLIDCGTDIRLALRDHNMTYRDITDVYISHLHADHCGGLEWLGFSRKFDPLCDRPTLYISEDLISDLWNKSLVAGMSSIQGKIATLEDYFKVHAIRGEKKFIWHNIPIQLIQTVHAMCGFSLMPSYGLFININDTKVFITTDISFIPSLYTFLYQQADIIFHDCETTTIPSGVHAHYKELVTLDAPIKSKMWLMHYNTTPTLDAKKDGFLGFVKKDQVFNF